MEHHHEHRDGGDRDEAHAQPGTLDRRGRGDRRPQRAVVDDADDQCGDHGGPDGGQGHAREVRTARQVEVTEHDEVGEVRSGQHQGARVRQQQARVEEGGLSLASAAGRVDEHRGQERDRGVEVQQRGDSDDQQRGARIEGQPVG